MIGTEKKKLIQSEEKLSDIQKYLLKLAEKLIVEEYKENLYPLDLLEIAKGGKKYPENDLFKSITELYELKWIVPGESLTKNHVLDSLDHQKVYQFILSHPGCDTLDVMTGLNISFRYALKNLETLFKFRFIRARKFSQFFLYFPFFMAEEDDMIYCLARNLTTRQIMRYLLETRTAATTFEIARAIKKTEINVQRKLTRLAHAQIISIVDDGIITKYKIDRTKKNGSKLVLNIHNGF